MTKHTLFSASQDDRGLLLTLTTDRCDLSVAEELKHGMRRAVGSGNQPVTVDMVNVEFIDSSGLGALVSLRKHLGQSRDMRLRNTKPFVEKVMKLTKLDKVFAS